MGTQSLDSVTITIGSVQYTLTPIYSQETWNYLNALQKYYRDRNLLVADYTDGTATVTLDSTTLTGVSTTFTAAMVGRWFTITDTSVRGQGYWYRVTGFTSTTALTISPKWTQATATSKTYRIGETPELPEGAHILLPDGTASDYYAGLRNDSETAARWDNKFWTGTYTNTSRKMDDKNISSGLIGLVRRYKDRTRDNIVLRQPPMISPAYKIFAQTLS